MIHVGAGGKKKRSLICRLRPPGTERLSDLPWGPTETQQEGANKARALSSGLSSATSDNLRAGKQHSYGEAQIQQPLITVQRSM